MYKFIIFDLNSTNPVDVAKSLADAKSRLKIITNTKGGKYAVKPFKRYSALLEKNDPTKYDLLLTVIEDKPKD